MKKTSDSKLKKQLVSGAVYIALAVTVVAVTVSTITATFSGNDNDSEKNNLHIDGTIYGNNNNLKLPEIKPDDFTLDTPVLDVKQGVEANVNDNKTASEPKDKDTKPDNDNGAAENPPDKNTEAADNQQAEKDEKPKEPEKTEPNKSRPQSEEPAEQTFELGYDGYIKPCTGYISKEFSVDVPVYSATMYDYRTHSGVDVACDIGTPVRAVTNGVISDVYEDYMLGTTVVIQHAEGITSVYSNLSPELPAETAVGKSVQTGQTIAGVGSSALCESAEVSHLHFELTKDGSAVDPEEYIVW